MNKRDSYQVAERKYDPPLLYPEYVSTQKRAPRNHSISIAHSLSEITGPRFVPRGTEDMTRDGGGEALGERIIMTGRVLDEDGRAIPETVLEIWQANAAGRYAHDSDQHDAPLDPHFSGVGIARTNESGIYQFKTIRPGAYPWRNHYNGWRPAHIHFSIFGPAFATRLITQIYFEGDPLLALDPIFNAVPEDTRQRLVATFDLDATVPEQALAYRFDFILRGRDATPLETLR